MKQVEGSLAVTSVSFLKIFLTKLYICFCDSLSDVVCFGVGAGANVLTELAVSGIVECQ